jgi:hypothetical protein
VRADEILDSPPDALRELPAEDVTTLLRVLERLQQRAHDPAP